MEGAALAGGWLKCWASQTPSAPVSDSIRINPSHRALPFMCVALNKAASANKTANIKAMASTLVCCPSTHKSHNTVANMGKARPIRKLIIHAPGRGSQLDHCGIQAKASMGSAKPSPRLAKISKAAALGRVKASPKEAPMNGAVHGEAMRTVSAPDK